VAWSAQRQFHEERFSELYLDETAAGAREISVLFADLEGFTTFSERHDPREVSKMLTTYFEVAIPPVVRRHGATSTTSSATRSGHLQSPRRPARPCEAPRPRRARGPGGDGRGGLRAPGVAEVPCPE
jgi:class 3 adenylate cyclase